MSSTLAARDTAAVSSGTRVTRKHLLITLAALAALTAAAWYVHGWWTTGRFIESTDDAYVGGNVTTISPHIAGFVADILVTDNQHVSAGQLLLRLDDRDVRAAAIRAAAVVRARAAALASLRAQIPLQQSRIVQADADAAGAAARAKFAAQDATRYAALAQTNAGSGQDAQRAVANAATTRAALQSATAAQQATREQLDVLGTQIAEATAAVAEAAAALQSATLDLGYATLTAPVDGYIGNRAAQTGAYVPAGTYLLSVIPSGGLWIDANYKEDQLAHMRQGQKVSIVADVAPGRTFHGHVQSLAPGTGAVFSVIPAENATGNFTKIVQRVPVRIALDAPDAVLGTLRPGLSATVSIDTR